VEGTPLDGSKILKRFKLALTRAGVRDVRFHDLRHTFGTRMAAAGVPMRTLQEWMGHRDFATTLVYADYEPSEHEVAWAEQAFAAPTIDAAGEGAVRHPPDLSGGYLRFVKGIQESAP
jgi:integrase